MVALKIAFSKPVHGPGLPSLDGQRTPGPHVGRGLRPAVQALGPGSPLTVPRRPRQQVGQAKVSRAQQLCVHDTEAVRVHGAEGRRRDADQRRLGRRGRPGGQIRTFSD